MIDDLLQGVTGDTKSGVYIRVSGASLDEMRCACGHSEFKWREAKGYAVRVRQVLPDILVWVVGGQKQCCCRKAKCCRYDAVER